MKRILSPVIYRRGGKHSFTLEGDLMVNLHKGYCGNHVLMDGGRVWAVLRGDILTIKAGYAFDGCSPAILFLGVWAGTPTPEAIVPAAAVHDVLRGYMKLPCVPFTRKDSDDIFYDMLREARFPLANEYHGVVSGVFGNLYIRMTAARPSAAKCGCCGCCGMVFGSDIRPLVCLP